MQHRSRFRAAYAVLALLTAAALMAAGGLAVWTAAPVKTREVPVPPRELTVAQLRAALGSPVGEVAVSEQLGLPAGGICRNYARTSGGQIETIAILCAHEPQQDDGGGGASPSPPMPK